MNMNQKFAAGGAVWPVINPVYVTSQCSPTFSFVEKSFTIAPAISSHTFALEIASIFADISEGQEPLGAEFEAVWDKNAEVLYQS